jgi:MFS family permease
MFGGVVNIAAGCAYMFVDSIGPVLFAVRMLHGLAQGTLFSVLFTIAADIVPASRRTQGIGLFGVSGMIPFGIAGLTGDAILARADYPDLFAFTIGCAALGFLVGLALPDSRPTPTDGEEARRAFLTAVLERPLLPIWVGAGAFALALASYFAFLKTYVIARGIGSVGSFFAVYTLTAVSLRVLAGRVPERLGARRTFIPSLFLSAIGIALLAWADTNATVLIAAVLTGAGHAYAFPIASALVVDRSRPGERGTTLAGFTALFDLGLLVGAPAYGFILERTDYRTMFTTAAATVAIGAIAFALWDRDP